MCTLKSVKTRERDFAVHRRERESKTKTDDERADLGQRRLTEIKEDYRG
jgi:hypothetical protein